MSSRALRRMPVGAALVAWRVWKRLPPPARRRALLAARSHGMRLAVRHGPRLAGFVAKRKRSRVV
ncbi:MAG TPA: hypothetical protein VEH79_01455 [Gaiellaceae bacterium]|nr:hypothetical protein [Gaiellaceae bacterium]